VRLSDDRQWQDQSGRVWNLEDLDPQHRRNIIRFVERNIRAAVRRAIDECFDALMYVTGEWQAEDAEEVIEQQLCNLEELWMADDETLHAWLHTTPLVRRLDELVLADEIEQHLRDEAPPEAEWWEEA
jgi:hypothetical protein